MPIVTESFMLKSQLLRETVVEKAGELLEAHKWVISSRARLDLWREGSETMHLLPKAKAMAKI